MNAHELYASLLTAGLGVWTNEGKLLVSPAEKITPGQADAIRAVRDELFAIASGPIWIRWANGSMGQLVLALDPCGWPKDVVQWSTEADKDWREIAYWAPNPLAGLTDLQLLLAHGFTVTMQGEQLMVGPTEKIDTEGADFIRANKAAIIAELTNQERQAA